MAAPALTIRNLKARSVVLPMKRKLATRVLTIESAALLLIDLETEEGITGRTYLFGYTPRFNAHLAQVLSTILEMTRGERIAPLELFPRLRKGLTLIGHEGLTLMAVSGFDMACWDALAQAAGQPLIVLLGGSLQPVRAYNSNGLGLMEPAAVGEQAAELVAEGNFGAVKIRLGRETLAEDLAALRAARKAVGDQVLMPCDFNQGLTVEEAVRRCHALDDEGVFWIEEPIAYDNLAGCARIARETKTPIMIGENFYGPKAMADAIAAGACDYVMPDVQRIGGVTGWLRAAAIAEAAGMELSSHTFPEVSCHLLAATPTRHLLEYVDWANPVLETPLEVADGHVLIPDVPGTGVAWNEEAVKQFQVEM